MTTPNTTIAGVKFSFPDKPMYPELKFTKLDVAKYYESVAHLIIPDIIDRPITLVRAPHGVDDFRFYQKHPSETFPKYIDRVQIQEKEKIGTYITIDALNDLMYLVNLEVIEFHTWQSKAQTLEQPDRIVFDLDPDPQAPWLYVIKAAHFIREKLNKLGIECFVKTSGIKGLHIVVPFTLGPTWEQAKIFAKEIGSELVEEHTNLFTTDLPKEKRTGKVFIDYLRNTRGATNVAAYSLRTVPSGAISTPIEWDEVTEQLDPQQFTVKNIAERIASSVNPWAKYATIKQELPLSILN